MSECSHWLQEEEHLLPNEEEGARLAHILHTNPTFRGCSPRCLKSQSCTPFSDPNEKNNALGCNGAQV